jgi:hypothetical protein
VKIAVLLPSQRRGKQTGIERRVRIGEGAEAVLGIEHRGRVGGARLAGARSRQASSGAVGGSCNGTHVRETSWMDSRAA